MSMLATLALVLAASPASCGHVHAGSCGGHDWRANLPAHLQAVVQKHDQENPPPSVEEKIGPLPAEVTPDEVRHRRDIERDIEEGREYAALVEKELKLSQNKDAQARLDAIGQEVAEIANATQVNVLWGDRRLSKFNYTFKLVEGDDVNAFSLPGGFIYFYEGLLKFAETDDELAAVVAHEIAHASFRHMATLRREQMKLDILNIPLLIAVAMSRDQNLMGAAMAAQYATQGLVSGWSVQAETSADYGAIQYLGVSRYNPVGMLTFMERLAYRDRFAPQIQWGIYQTHPPSEERTRFLVKALNERGIPIKRSQTTTSLAARSMPKEDGTFDVWFGSQKLHTFRGDHAKDRAARAVLRLNDFFDTVPQTFQFSVSGGEMVGNGRSLFVIESGDLVEDQTVDSASAETARLIRRAIFELGFQLWKPGS